MLPEKEKRKRQPRNSSSNIFPVLVIVVLLLIVASLGVVIIAMQESRNSSLELTTVAIQAQNATIAAFINETQNAPTPTLLPLSTYTPSPLPPSATPLPIPTFDSVCEGEWVVGSMFDLNRTPRVKQDFAVRPDVDVQVVTQGEFCLLPNEIAPGPEYRENRVDTYLVVQVASDNITGTSPDLTRDPAKLAYLGDLTRQLLNVLVEQSIIHNNNGIVHITFMAENSWRTLVFTWAQYFRVPINQLTEATAVTGALGGISDLMTR